MYEVQQTESFARWLRGLRDLRAYIALSRRMERAESGNLGDYKSLGGGIHEMRLDISGGYRIYFTQRGRRLNLLLVGGDKASQSNDIIKARKLAKELK
ncbi:type II toxin-antitoxin system RelE/ParE family toxin [Pseudomonas sp. LS_2]